MPNKLNILFASLDAFGHVLPCIGFAEALRDRGHRIVFAIDKSWKGKLNEYGFEEELYSISKRKDSEMPSEYWANIIRELGNNKNLRLSPLRQWKAFGVKILIDMIKQSNDINEIMSEIVERNKPDVIVINSLVCMPALVNCGIPWINLVSGNPLMFVDHRRLPPCTSVKHGLPLLPLGIFMHHSPYLNLYSFPQEIDYTDIRPMPEKWHRIDAFIRTDNENFELPERLKKREGKLIYVSMGSLGSADISLMTRLIDILKRSPHKFIVSTGLSHRKIQLPDNMCGHEMVPQMKVLPIVDLVITHGGNNTITETLYFGKPMIVMPLFFDQPDNAQRIEEKGFGVKLNAYDCSDVELLSSVEKLLADKEMAYKLEYISKRMKSSNNIMTAVRLVEQISKEYTVSCSLR